MGGRGKVTKGKRCQRRGDSLAARAHLGNSCSVSWLSVIMLYALAVV